jgi:hypothetical protein
MDRTTGGGSGNAEPLLEEQACRTV